MNSKNQATQTETLRFNQYLGMIHMITILYERLEKEMLKMNDLTEEIIEVEKATLDLMAKEISRR